MVVSWAGEYCLPVDPRVATRMIEAEPITMPSMVRRNRVLLARKLSTASLTTSLNIMVERALASVGSKEDGVGRFGVAIPLTMRPLPLSQPGTVFRHLCPGEGG